jgi:hypothetical protein
MSTRLAWRVHAAKAQKLASGMVKCAPCACCCPACGKAHSVSASVPSPASPMNSWSWIL